MLVGNLVGRITLIPAQASKRGLMVINMVMLVLIAITSVVVYLQAIRLLHGWQLKAVMTI